jgi:hypothetical protein
MPPRGFRRLDRRPARAGDQDYEVKYGGRAAGLMGDGGGSGGGWGPNWESIPEKTGTVESEKQTDKKRESAK